ncbi:MAG: CinA family nicotinamide mononucleotide deamidase-related protein [Brevinematales bacterium]|nr:CinA family nicotinamide mononucleotide deamidase-related protein [Brevinematales bacterium]
MKAALLTIGNELLDGRIIDTNSVYIERELLGKGIVTSAKLTVRDDLNEIRAGLDYLARFAECIIITGGLGPTVDDLTREAVAGFLGRKLVFDPAVFAMVESFFLRLGRKAPDGNKSQANVIDGSEVLTNPNGTAPGFYIDTVYHGRPLAIASFPGVPSELRGMFPALMDRLNAENTIPSVYVRTVGLPEGLLNDRIAKILPEGLSFGTIAIPGMTDLRFDNTTRAEIDALLDKAPLVRRKTYTFDTDETIAAAVVREMTALGKNLTTAESCTGGMIASMITDAAGSSAVFLGGVTVYDNRLKERLLNVPAETLAEYGAVSHETAFAMLAGLRGIADTDYRIAVTGIAGPSGGTDAKPVGTVFIGYSDPRGDISLRFYFHGGRGMVRTRASVKVFEILYDALKYGKPDLDRIGALEIRRGNGG